MTTPADVIARITDRVQFVAGADPASIARDQPLMGQARFDSLDLYGLAMSIEEEFGIPEFDVGPSSTVDSIADAVIAALKSPLPVGHRRTL